MNSYTSVRTRLLQRLLGTDPSTLSSTKSHESLVWVSSLGMWLLMPGPLSDSTSELLRQTLSNESAASERPEARSVALSGR
jgi:hypothetical protein